MFATSKDMLAAQVPAAADPNRIAQDTLGDLAMSSWVSILTSTEHLRFRTDHIQNLTFVLSAMAAAPLHDMPIIRTTATIR